MVVARVDPTITEEWDAQLRTFQKSTFFHGSHWSRVIRASYGYKPYYLVFGDRNGPLSAIFPFFLVELPFRVRRLISLPFTDFCAPLIREDTDLSAIVPLLENELRKVDVGYMEIRGVLPSPIVSTLRIQSRVDHVSFVVDLTKGIDGLWNRLKPNSVRYRIRRAQKAGVTVAIEQSSEAMLTFCRLNRLTRRRHGIVPQPERFFRSLYEEVISKGFGHVMTAKIASEPVAAAVFLFDNETMFCKYSASDERFRDLGANHLILWKAIEWANSRKLHSLDLGRTSATNSGLLMYKRGWGAQEGSLAYSYWPRVQGQSRVNQTGFAYRLAKAVVPRIPVPILQFAGDVVYGWFG